MKIGAVSGDLVIKLGLAVAVIGALAYFANKAAKALPSVGQAADAVVAGVTPWNSSNVVNSAVTAAGASLSGDASWNLGGWLYDMTHSDAGVVATAPTPAPAVASDELPGFWGY